MALKQRDGGEAEARSAFLGVTRLVKGQNWRKRRGPGEARGSRRRSQQHDLPELLAPILAARGDHRRIAEGSSQLTIWNLLLQQIALRFPYPCFLYRLQSGL